MLPDIAIVESLGISDLVSYHPSNSEPSMVWVRRLYWQYLAAPKVDMRPDWKRSSSGRALSERCHSQTSIVHKQIGTSLKVTVGPAFFAT